LLGCEGGIDGLSKRQWIKLKPDQIVIPIRPGQHAVPTHARQPTKQKIKKRHALDLVVGKMSLLAASRIGLVREKEQHRERLSLVVFIIGLAGGGPRIGIQIPNDLVLRYPLNEPINVGLAVGCVSDHRG